MKDALIIPIFCGITYSGMVAIFSLLATTWFLISTLIATALYIAFVVWFACGTYRLDKKGKNDR